MLDFYFPEKINTKEFVVLSETNRYALVTALQKKGYDFVFSVSYIHEVSVVCNMMGVLYLSWTMEYPNMDLLRDSVINPCNCFFLSDKAEIDRLISLGVENVFYLPAAARNVVILQEEDFKQEANGEEEDVENGVVENVVIETEVEDAIEKYLVSYFGKILEADPHSCFATDSTLSAESRGYLDGLVHCQRIAYGMNVLKGGVPVNVLADLKEKYPLSVPTGVMVSEWEVYLKKWIYNRVSSQERLVLVQGIDDVVTVFSKDEMAYKYFSRTKLLDEGVKKEAVIVNSRINLHIADRQLQRGIPANVFEIMAQGGFLLCSYCPDMEEFFVPRKDYAYFEDEHDLKQKINFYLRKGKKRREMAKCAYEKVQKEHLVIHRMEKMLQILL